MEKGILTWEYVQLCFVSLDNKMMVQPMETDFPKASQDPSDLSLKLLRMLINLKQAQLDSARRSFLEGSVVSKNVDHSNWEIFLFKGILLTEMDLLQTQN